MLDADDDDLTEVPTPSSSQVLVTDIDAESAQDEDQLDADHRLALALAEEGSPSPSSSQSRDKEKDKDAWSSLFARTPAPRCTVHGEPARLYTVNKPGPNRGKTFYICSRPVGPGYDKGRGERVREEVDHRYRCNFFKWASEARKEARREMEAKGKGREGAAQGG